MKTLYLIVIIIFSFSLGLMCQVPEFNQLGGVVWTTSVHCEIRQGKIMNCQIQKGYTLDDVVQEWYTLYLNSFDDQDDQH